MRQTKHIATHPGNNLISSAKLFLSCAGISFCFFIGFPFANQNESYMWVAYFNKVSLWHAFTWQFAPVTTFRPLGVATAWLAFHLNGNIFLQQVINYLFVIASIAVLYSASKNKIAFAFMSFLNGSLFFSGYIFLFHLHGVFYGPFELYFACLIKVSTQRKCLPPRLFYALFIVTLLVSLYHTFCLLLFVFFILGFLKKKSQTFELIFSIVAIIACVALSKLLSPGVKMLPLMQMVNGFMTSFKMVEINLPQSIAALLFCLLVSLQLTEKFRMKIVYGLLTVVTAVVLFVFKVPILFLWVSLCLFETYRKKSWPLFFLLSSTLLIPVFSSTGSPTYSIFTLLICTFLTANSAKSMLQPVVWNRIAFLTVLMLTSGLILVKLDIRMPILSKMVDPILAEKEKTFQLEHVISWAYASKDFSNNKLQFFENAENPVKAKNSINRTHRPPTTQNYLDFYRNNFYKNFFINKVLYLTFGNQKIEGKKIVYQIKGRYNGNAYVYQ